MNLSFADFKKLISRNIGNKDKKDNVTEEDTEEELDETAMKSGSHDPVKGIKRKYVKFIALGFASVLLIAIIYSSNSTINNSSDGDDDKRMEQPANAKQVNPNSNNYENLIRANQAANGHNKKLTPEQEEAKKQAMLAEAAAKQGTNSETVKAEPVKAVPIPANQYPQIPTAIPTQQEQQQSPVVTTVSEKNDKYGSAIAFGIGGGMTASSDGDTSVAQLARNEANIAYTAANDKALLPGSVIPAILLTGLNTDSPGQVAAQVTSNIYDTAYGYNLLIPAGTKFIGSYNGASNGRITVVFSTMVLPNGAAYTVGDSFVATDSSGFNGIKGSVDGHTDKVFASGAIGAGIAALSSIATGTGYSGSNNTYSAGQLAMQGAMANIINNASSLITKGTSVTPTTKVEPGTLFNIMVTKNVILNPY